MLSLLALSLALSGSASADPQVELTLDIGPEGPSFTQTVELSALGLIHTETLRTSEREQLEVRVFLDEHLTGPADQTDQYRFSAEIYALTLNRWGGLRDRELVSRPRIRTVEGQAARIVQSQVLASGARQIALTMTPHNSEVSAAD